MNIRRAKYPRITHLPWSPGRSEDDIALDSIEHLERLEDIVVTEKLDGENTTLYHDYLHARSIDSRSHPSRIHPPAPFKGGLPRFHAKIRYDIPEDFRICGENMYAKHSIFYDSLTTYFYVFAIFQAEMCLSWDDTVEWCKLIGAEMVPVLYRRAWNEKAIKACWRGTSVFGKEQEGYDEFRGNVAKYVRAAHVTTNRHWMQESVTPNQLAA